MFPPQLNGLPTVPSISHDLQVALLIDDGDEAIPDDSVILGDQNADGWSCHRIILGARVSAVALALLFRLGFHRRFTGSR